MAYIIDDKTRKDRVIYVLMEAEPGTQFYIGATLPHRLYKTYIEHACLRVEKTRDLFQKHIDAGTALPRMYILENNFMNKWDTTRHCIAWLRYFVDHGYTPIPRHSYLSCIDDLLPETQEIFDRVADKDPQDLLSPPGGQFPNYTPQSKDARMEHTQITISVDDEEYQQIKDKAEEINFSLSAYCRQMVLNGKINRLELDHLTEYMAAYRDSKTLLRMILFSIYTTGNYYPADLAKIQNHIDYLTDLYNKALKDITKLLKAV